MTDEQTTLDVFLAFGGAALYVVLGMAILHWLLDKIIPSPPISATTERTPNDRWRRPR